MVMELGQTDNPKELIPGDPGAVAQAAGAMYAYANALSAAGAGLGRIDTNAGWSGAAADAFRRRFHGHPHRFSEAATERGFHGRDGCWNRAHDGIGGRPRGPRGGDDHVSPAQSSEGASQDVGSAQDPQHFQDLGLDPATGQFRLGEAQTASRIENETGVRLDRSTAARDLIG